MAAPVKIKGSTFSVPAVKYAKQVTCGYYDLTKSPSGWGKTISSIANWTSSSHYYYDQKNAKGNGLTVTSFTSKSSLSSTFDNKDPEHDAHVLCGLASVTPE